jgi:hypothetical protein
MLMRCFRLKIAHLLGKTLDRIACLERLEEFLGLS